jgi:hypothetical protein
MEDVRQLKRLADRKTWLVASGFVLYSLIIVSRGIRGLDQIPSDPGYSAIAHRIGHPLKIIGFQPYLHTDQLMIASIAAFVQIDFQGIVASLITHAVWTICAVVICLSLVRLQIARWVSYVSGLTLALCPWAAQSSLGNFGNVRWPILTAVVVVVACESTRPTPNTAILIAASCVAAITNPIAVVIVVSLLINVLHKHSVSIRQIMLVGAPVTAVLILNISMNGLGGHGAKVATLWDGAGLFWLSGVYLPPALSVLGIVLSLFLLKSKTETQAFCYTMFTSSLAVALLSYQLGGIADRYFVTPAVLVGIGLLVLVDKATAHHRTQRILALGTLGIVLLLPTWQWFSVFPYLSNAPKWSLQVDSARQLCTKSEIQEFQLITSDGTTNTDPLQCELLK